MNLEEQLNFYGEKKEPFFFIVNYDKTQYEIIPLKNLPKNIKYQMSKDNKYKKHAHQLLKTYETLGYKSPSL